MNADKDTARGFLTTDELVTKAKYELEIFDRVAMDTGAKLVAEVERLRELIHRAKEESELIQHKGKPAIAVPYWFIKS
jgi:hypothetical protein